MQPLMLNIKHVAKEICYYGIGFKHGGVVFGTRQTFLNHDRSVSLALLCHDNHAELPAKLTKTCTSQLRSKTTCSIAR